MIGLSIPWKIWIGRFQDWLLNKKKLELDEELNIDLQN
jgi:hypothetical protein